MSKTVLFSPVGGTDPISQNNMRDGSLLHICRWYKPDEVYLYMSKEMLDFQKQDDRYRYCINELAKMQNREIEINEIERPDLVNVQEFDFFYEDFRKCIMEIQNSMEEDDKLILNISSGTPAMKSGLLVLATLGEFDCLTVQVDTPTRKLNEHTHMDYENELWEINEDNEDGAENRCRVVYCPTLSNIKQEEIIKQLIREYDYSAALLAAKQLPADSTKEYLELIQVGLLRLQLDERNYNSIVTKRNMPGFPVKSGDIKKYFEYLLALDIKRKRGEYADFVRALSPIIVDLFSMILENECKFNIKNYTSVDRNTGAIRWDSQKLAGTDIERILKNQWSDFGYGKPVAGVHLLQLIYEKCKGKTDLINTAQALRDIEGNIRNLAAHQIVSVTDDVVLKLTGHNALSVMKLLKKAFSYAGIKVKEEQWNAYDDMNDYIITVMEHTAVSHN